MIYVKLMAISDVRLVAEVKMSKEIDVKEEVKTLMLTEKQKI